MNEFITISATLLVGVLFYLVYELIQNWED